MSDMNRREALAFLAIAPFAPAIADPRSVPQVPSPAAGREPTPARRAQARFFTAAEIATVTLLADMILPADERSGSASDAGVPEFIDFMMTDTMDASLPGRVRGGLAWMDVESRRRHGRRFVEAGEQERAALLDDIAWPDRAPAELSHGVAFFSLFRDLVASGFWSSEMGIEDIGYLGNTAVPEWRGCPPAVLDRLGIPRPEG